MMWDFKESLASAGLSLLVAMIGAMGAWSKRQVAALNRLRRNTADRESVDRLTRRVIENESKLRLDKARLDRIEVELAENRDLQRKDHDALIRVDERTATMSTAMGHLNERVDDVHEVLTELLQQAKAQGTRGA